jgi:O-antigen/teichoic acid export membrane protein
MYFSSPYVVRILAIIRTAFSVAAGRIFSIALFILTARHFSAEDNASFVFAVTLSQLLIQLGTLGWLSLIRREISRRHAMSAELVKGFIFRSFQIPLAAITVVAACLVILPIYLNEPRQFLYIEIAALTVVFALAFILREYLTALGYPAYATFAAETVPFVIALGLIFFIKPALVETAVLMVMAGVALSCCIQIPVLIRCLRPFLMCGRPAYQTKEWLRTSSFALLGFGGRTI